VKKKKKIQIEVSFLFFPYKIYKQFPGKIVLVLINFGKVDSTDIRWYFSFNQHYLKKKD
jgi:hypothetical protein